MNGGRSTEELGQEINKVLAGNTLKLGVLVCFQPDSRSFPEPV